MFDYLYFAILYKAKQMNERITENIVRNLLSKVGYYKDKNLIIEEQKSDSPIIDKLLTNASKKGLAHGFPEFIIRSKVNTDFLIVIECKADIRKHKSNTNDKYSEYAVDGVLLYASYLAKQYDVLAIAISGQNEKELKISHFLKLKDSHNFYNFLGKEILNFNNYYESYKKSDIKFNQDYSKLLSYAKYLNVLLHSKKIKEAQRSLLISGILIALQNKSFRSSFTLHKTASQLANQLLTTIVDEFTNAKLTSDNITNLKQAFSFIQTHTTLTKDKEFFEFLISDIDGNINNFIKTYHFFDILGQFYIEFLRYANNDKGLGIVLTPPHITELFAELADVDKESIVYDNCCGTGGFLISSMKKMIGNAKGNEETINRIKIKQLIGVEYQDDIYALCISNMVIHNDGKTNISRGDCFELSGDIGRKHHPNIGLLNPPYKVETEDPEEFKFILNNLEILQTGGTCVAIVPLSCALALSGVKLEYKKQLLEKHTLEAVMSMPEELFHNSKTNVVTCTMVITANRPHPKGKKTWLGYWRKDGFVKTKNKGRIDLYQTWREIKNNWVKSFLNREVIKGLSLMQELKPDDEWCAENFIETDYSELTKESFKKIILDYISHCVFKEDLLTIKNFASQKELSFNTNNWKEFKLSNLFKFSLGKPIHKNTILNSTERYKRKHLLYVTRTTTNNGVELFVNPDQIEERFIQNGNTITIGAEGFHSYYQKNEFITGNKVNILRNKNINEFSALFINTVLNLEIKKKFNYGRGLVKSRLEKLSIKLPSFKNQPDYNFMEKYIKGLQFNN